jgi:catechol 2,3-dioxygenase-like lactoylglutathione lyase family enzyme
VELESLDHVGLAVADVQRSIRWYEDVLGLKRAFEEAWHDYPAVLLAGDSGVALFPARGAPVQSAGSLDALPHVGFRTSRRGYEDAKRQLRAKGIEFRESDHRIAWSLYMLDPDGHLIEVTTYDPADPSAG